LATTATPEAASEIQTRFAAHIPAAGAIDAAYRYAGGADMEGEGWVPNITQHKDGVAEWSAKDIAWMLKSGDTPEGDVVGGSMKSVVKNMAELPDADRNAIATYIHQITRWEHDLVGCDGISGKNGIIGNHRIVIRFGLCFTILQVGKSWKTDI
jgi:hypothetical protein